MLLLASTDVRPSETNLAHCLSSTPPLRWQGGTELNFIVAIDYTASNGNPRDPNSLHYYSQRPTMYEGERTRGGRVGGWVWGGPCVRWATCRQLLWAPLWGPMGWPRACARPCSAGRERSLLQGGTCGQADVSILIRPARPPWLVSSAHQTPSPLWAACWSVTTRTACSLPLGSAPACPPPSPPATALP